MTLTFPSNPTLNQTTTTGGRTFKWNGKAWDLVGGGLVIADAPSDSVTYGRRNAAWVDMTAPANLQVRRGTAAEVAAITPLSGEPVWDTTNKHLYVGDGSTAGGISVGHKLVDSYGGNLNLRVLSANHEFGQATYVTPSDGEVGLAIPANSLVIGSAYRLGPAGLAEGTDQYVGFTIGWSGDTDALFGSQTAANNSSGVRMLETPLWVTSQKQVIVEPPGATASNMEGVIRISVYFYSLTAIPAIT